MNKNKLWLYPFAFILLFSFNAAEAQKKSQKPAKKTTQSPSKTTKKPAETKKNTQPPAEKTKAAADQQSITGEGEGRVKNIVSFLQYVLNTLGDTETSSRDKDVLITESYTKIFRDAKVQVEDDLDQDRKVITNKDVIAYLKDVDFFYKEIKFEFTIEDIKQSTLPSGDLFYKVSLTRNLKGTTSEGQAVSNTIPRFIEINYNPDDQDLKIVSIYTNEIDEKEALLNWWKELSYEWQSIFKKKLDLTDSVDITDIKDITSVEELDLNNNKYIQSIDPLGRLSNLKLLNLSGTNVSDLTPIRNLSELIELNLAGTKVFDLSPLKYASKMERLNINDTEVRSIAVLEKMTALKNLELRGTHVFDFASLVHLTALVNLNVQQTQFVDFVPVQSLSQLLELNVTSTPIQNLNGVKDLKALQSLTIDSTRIRDISEVSNLANLKVLSANYTLISDLQPLQKLTQLEKIYCDHTQITRDKADAFMAVKPSVLVVYDSKDLLAWWQKLPLEWQTYFEKIASLPATPGKDELARLTTLDSINISGLGYIKDFEPLRKLLKLKTVIASKTAVKDLAPLKDHRQIRYLDIDETAITDLTVLSNYPTLKVLRADRTKIESIEPLYNLGSLEQLYVDQTFVHDIIAKELLDKNPKCLVVYKTVHLNRWWNGLSSDWKQVFYSQMEKDTSATRENLHLLAERERLTIKDSRVNDLSALSEFVTLKELHFSGTAIKTVPAMENLKSLRSLHASNSPIQNIETLKAFPELEDLDISNTPVDELKPVSSLANLKSLNCAGTQIKKIDPLERLDNLETFDCSNTRVGNLDPIMRLSLKSLKCYNTKISSKDVEKFKERNPDCNVIFYR